MLCDGEKLNSLIDRYVNGKKAERNRDILKAVYLGGKTYEEAAEMCGVSPIQVSRIIHRYGDPILLMMDIK